MFTITSTIGVVEMEPYKLSKKELQSLNQGLIEIANIKEDLDRARMAGVPNTEYVITACEVCEERINKLLATYNPKGKK